MKTKNVIDKVKQKSKTDYIYIVTCKRYALIDLFKVEKTDNLLSRTSCFNSYTEQNHGILDNYRDKK